MRSCERGITDRATIPSLNSPFLTRLFEGTAGVCVYTDKCVCGEPKWAARAEAGAWRHSGLRFADMQPAPPTKTAEGNKRPKSAQMYLHA